MDHVPPQHQHDADDGRRSVAEHRRRPFLALALGLCVLAMFVALGTWQVRRRAWKHDLIARTERHLAAPPVAPPMRAMGAADAYLKVRLRGRFLHDRETLVRALTERGAGFWVLTPLAGEGGVVLVNRGFVPPERRTPATRAAGLPEGMVTFTGLLRLSEPGGTLLRANDPDADRWYSRDVAAIARARRLGRIAPYFIDADGTPNPGGLPVGGLTVVAFPDNHLVYALTWYGLALLTAGALTRLVRTTAKRGDAAADD